MGKRVSIAGVGVVLLVGAGLGPTGNSTGVKVAASRAATPSASRPTSDPADAATSRPSSDDQIRELIRRLAAPGFRERDAAQRRLTELGDAAVPTLIEFVNDPNPEVSTRVSTILRSPADPALRVRLALAWIRTQKSEYVERAAYMVFDDAEHCDAAFIDAAKELHGPEGRGAAAVAERLAGWRRQYSVFLTTYEKARKRNPASAEALLKTQADSKLYQAEAAFWEAMDAIDEAGAAAGGDSQPGAAGAAAQKRQASQAGTTKPADGG